MAEALMRQKSPVNEVQSAGIFAGGNDRANEKTIHVLKEVGISLDHASQPVTNQLLNWADLVLTMTTGHKHSLILHHPNFQDKYFTLKEYVLGTDKESWKELKKAYATYEERRSIFIQENERKLDNKRLDEMIAYEFQEDIIKIRQLEADLINYDISDPFGGEIGTYQDTLKEIEKYIELILKK